MKRTWSFFICLMFLLGGVTLPAMAADTSAEIEELKEEVKNLLKRIEELENKQAEAKQAFVEPDKKTAEPPKTWQAGYDRGFYIKTPDENFTLKTNLFFQFRYTYLDFDDKVSANDEDWSNFFLRRARVFFTGNAPNKDWTYYFHLQLEPQSSVNLHDAYVTWKRYPYAQVQVGRSKIPYGLEFMQSASLLNGVERTIFSGETDVDGKEDSRKWPGGNANFQVSAEDSVTKYPVGGLNLFRSQGLQIQGAIDIFDREAFLQYWAGVYNGRNTKAGVNIDSTPLFAGRISINPFGTYNLAQQGDIDSSKDPKLCLLVSGVQYRERLTKYRKSTDGDGDGVGDSASDLYDIEGTGYNLAALFRFRGFSLDAEYGHERFEQDRTDGNTWSRSGYRLNTGYFLLPKKLEMVARYAYVERMEDNTQEKSLASGLGLVKIDESSTYNSIEDSLREYTVGLNYYFDMHRLKLSLDYSHLVRDLITIEESSTDDQHDNRFRTVIQYFF